MHHPPRRRHRHLPPRGARRRGRWGWCGRPRGRPPGRRGRGTCARRRAPDWGPGSATIIPLASSAVAGSRTRSPGRGRTRPRSTGGARGKGRRRCACAAPGGRAPPGGHVVQVRACSTIWFMQVGGTRRRRSPRWDASHQRGAHRRPHHGGLGDGGVAHPAGPNSRTAPAPPHGPAHHPHVLPHHEHIRIAAHLVPDASPGPRRTSAGSPRPPASSPRSSRAPRGAACAASTARRASSRTSLHEALDPDAVESPLSTRAASRRGRGSRRRHCQLPRGPVASGSLAQCPPRR